MKGDVKVVVVGEKTFSNMIRELSCETLKSDDIVLYGGGFLDGFKHG